MKPSAPPRLCGSRRGVGGLFTVFFACVLAVNVQAAAPIQHWVSPSGAQVFFVETHVLPMLDVQVDFAAGKAYDPPGKAGLAGMTQGLLNAGAGGMDEERIAALMADSGADLGGSVDQDRAGLHLRTLSRAEERDKALDLMRAMLQAPDFPQAVLEREKARAVAGIKEADTRPDALAEKRFMAAVFPGHPYGVKATAESVSAITQSDLAAFYRLHYGARRAVVSLVGDLTRAQAEAVVERLTNGLPSAAPDSASGQSLPDERLPDAHVERMAHPAAQSHIYVGMPGVKRGDPDYFPLLVGNYVLGGGGFVSRLTKEVREKRGYAYSVYSYFLPLRQPGPFMIGLTTKRSQAGDALKVVKDTLSGFLKDGPSEAELADAKRNLAGGFSLRLDSNRKMLDYVSVIGFYGLPLDYLDSFQSKVETVTTAQVKAAFARHVQASHLVTVIVAGD
ncbi:MAG: pitrilysin family protein [Rhodocyclaceae bacterium]|nr:pitrilysin family protein [Rhodocyclaceae bacterium]